jgi:hypothetical protein
MLISAFFSFRNKYQLQMFTYLQMLLGKPMKYYEMLMQSKSEHASITQKDRDSLYEQLRPHELNAIVYTEKREVYNILTPNYVTEIPVNKKGVPMLFKGNFILNDQLLTLFIDDKVHFSDSTSCRLILNNIDEWYVPLKNITKKQKNISCRSLPIWEEIIHRFPSIHRLIVSLNKEHPWTLYKETVALLKQTDYVIYLGGYPQWRINNIDYRNLKDLNFLMEYRQNDKDFSIYFFVSKTTRKIEFFKQKV